MIFGLFKKNQTADTVFVNGNIYTQDADLPWAEAVACKDGKIVYVGNSQEAEQFTGPETNVLDLEGKYMLPGFINTHSHPSIRIFEDAYISIPEEYDIDEVLGLISDYIFNNPEEETYFGYGFGPNLLKELTQEEASEKLDEVCSDKPIMLLSLGEGVFWVNNCALGQARAAAQEDGVLRISIDYFLQVVNPFNFEELQNKTLELASEYCSRGFTSIFNAGATEFMDNIYEEAIITMNQQDMIKQRYFGSFPVERNTKAQNVMNKLMQKRTNTTELDDFVHCNTLKINLRREDEFKGIESENLKQLIEEASERGFDVHIDPLDYKAFRECMEIITAVRNAGYRKNHFIVACDESLRKDSEGFSLDEMCLDNVYFQPSTKCDPLDEYGALEGSTSVEEIIDRLTMDAAVSLGISDKLGSIEAGKRADFTVYEENPFEVIKPSLFKKLSAEMTVIEGQIVYDAEEDNMQEWYNLMSGMQL
ncbi:amidohydrolase family protein [Aminipila sp.]|uniref:amidohydrolase family protein n=1 Tax=Aminipila sp. TaxID=2060095 RepID=UPI0028A0B244|nr:amidohydrolase family protein [Aminipila sp.]